MGCVGVSGVSPEKWLHSRQWARGPLERDSTQKYCLEGRREGSHRPGGKVEEAEAAGWRREGGIGYSQGWNFPRNPQK